LGEDVIFTTGHSYNPKMVSAYFVDCGLPKPQFEIRHIPDRKFRLDVGWPDKKIGIEIQGGIWVGLGHARRTNIRRDMTKNNLQILNGWKVLEVEPRELLTKETVEMIKAII
jgi:hypothetical protein